MAKSSGSGIEAPAGVRVRGPVGERYGEILTGEALAFLAELQRRFGAEREQLLARRIEVDKKLQAGGTLGFLPETEHVRKGDWKVAPIPPALLDRRVEITGPVDRKMIVNALNCGANVFMADFEDASTPTWANMVEGQINLRDAVRREIDFTDPTTGRDYKLAENTATLIVRPRGWHLPEAHVEIDGKPMSGGLFDFGLFFFHNAQAQLAAGAGPYFYLPKFESHLDARLWAKVFAFSENHLGVPSGSIRATVLIETILAAFEMDEILYELRDYAAGLNCGRWDYIFSYIKKFRSRPEFVLPDREQVGMTRHFLSSYSLLLIRTCHRRGAYAMGGMAAQIPIRSDPEASEQALAKVRADKEREAGNGHDGTWVAHPGLVPIAREMFDAKMTGPNQLDNLRTDVEVTAEDLVEIPDGTISEKGLRTNLNVGTLYIEAWLRGIGCVPLYNLMEDAATAEISRAQVWQWLKHGARFSDDGRVIDAALVEKLLREEMDSIKAKIGDEAYAKGKYDEAADLFLATCTPPDFVEFLTLPAYERVITLVD